MQPVENNELRIESGYVIRVKLVIPISNNKFIYYYYYYYYLTH